MCFDFLRFFFYDFFSLYKGEKVAQKEKLKKEYYYRTNSNTLFLSFFGSFSYEEKEQQAFNKFLFYLQK